MKKENISTLVIAGDIYDRSVPSSEAVQVLDEFLDVAVNQNHFQILMISGNHDSQDRIHFASALLKKQGLYIETEVHKKMEPIVIDDVHFYLLPFFKPSLIRHMYQQDSIVTYQQAFEEYFQHQDIDKNQKNVLVTHQFVGKNSIQSESEVILSVGGSEIIDNSLFEDFDYVALGHLHASQKVGRKTIRYSGSLMRYSFDEVKQEKSIVIVNTDDFSLSFHTLTPSIDLKVYQGYYLDFIKNDYISKKDDLLHIELLDGKIVPHAIEQLKRLYPHLLQLTYVHLSQYHHQVNDNMKILETMELTDLYQQFYQTITNQQLDEESLDIIKDFIEKDGEKNETIKS